MNSLASNQENAMAVEILKSASTLQFFLSIHWILSRECIFLSNN